MISQKSSIGIAVVAVFLIGSAYIMYRGRPVMNIPAQPSIGTSTSTPAGTTADTYTLADVATHHEQSNCWSAINGNVYDLTSWVSRHPGGSAAIIGLCGTDGTEAFTGQHGREKRPASTLVLLKIGILK